MIDINETKAALKCCARIKAKCNDCPLKYYYRCKEELIKRANRLVENQEKLIAKFGKTITGNGVNKKAL